MLFEPNYNLESIYDINIAELKDTGIKALFFDLDSTLMKSKSGKFSFQTLQFLNDLKSNFKIIVELSLDCKVSILYCNYQKVVENAGICIQ